MCGFVLVVLGLCVLLVLWFRFCLWWFGLVVVGCVVVLGWVVLFGISYF